MADSDLLIKADEEGVQLLDEMANNIDAFVESVCAYSQNFMDTMDEYPALGPHKKEMLEIIKEILLALNDSTGAASVVAGKLRQKRDEYQEWIDENRFTRSK